MVERVILIVLGTVGLVASILGARKVGWFRVVGEFPFAFVGLWFAGGSIALIVVGAVGLA